MWRIVATEAALDVGGRRRRLKDVTQLRRNRIRRPCMTMITVAETTVELRKTEWVAAIALLNVRIICFFVGCGRRTATDPSSLVIQSRLQLANTLETTEWYVRSGSQRSLTYFFQQSGVITQRCRMID